MKHFAAKKAKDNFGLLLDTAQSEPVEIAKNNRGVAVVISLAEFKRLESIESAWLSSQADAALKEGFIGKKESENLLGDVLNAGD